MEEFYTVQQAADALGLVPASLRDAVRRGKLVVHKLTPRVNVIFRDELERYRRESLGRQGWTARRRVS